MLTDLNVDCSKISGMILVNLFGEQSTLNFLTSLQAQMLPMEPCCWALIGGQYTMIQHFAPLIKHTRTKNETHIIGKFVIRDNYNYLTPRQMAMTGCRDDEFTCHDGSCQKMEKRCDGKSNCRDGTDEENCQTIVTFAGYNKFLVPEPIGTDNLLTINISFIIDEIITIDEKNGYFLVKLTFIRSWFNPQLKYQNLKKEATKNTMTEDDIEFMWIPFSLLNNIKHTDEIKKTEVRDTMFIIPNKEFKFKKGDKTNIQNTMLFDGSENSIQYERTITVNFICNYNMKWYPFDTQKCVVEMYHTEDSITLNPISVNYTGPKELMQHTVKGIFICAVTIRNRPGVVVEIHLGRPLFGSILTVFMPTLILIIISEMVGIFHKEYMDMVIGVNLTLLLVLATL